MKNKFHHYVSQFYLRKFAHTPGRNSKMYMYDFLENTEEPKARIGSNAGEDYFNECFGSDHLAIEHFYDKEIESPAGAALKRVLEVCSLESSQDLCDILLFFAMTTARNPKQREHIEEPIRQLDLMLLKTALGSDAGKAMKARSNRNLSSKEHVTVEIELIDPIHEALCKKNWSLLAAPSSGDGFITSDDPMQIVHASAPGNWGFDSEGAQLFAPLSPGLALFGGSGVQKRGVFTLTKEEVAAFNSETIKGAHRYIFARSGKFEVHDTSGPKRWNDWLALRS
ncbi:DUF4238 domain-containing protein [Pseudophaeobacter sp.]|uniref:DUF4238 domain-containing protein n=1 Tax=Pseudophaeobacter sp. TaxID=1971739 RepID=UPI003299EAFA